MSSITDKLVKTLLGKDSLDQCGVEELQQLARRYPYFPVTHFLLAGKWQGNDENKYREELKKLSLFFPDPAWLEHQLTQNGQAEIIPAKQPETDMIFEPYHTVDYFASQGIRMREEEKPVDKFGQQLKSFTEWLRSMKKLPVAEIPKAVEPSTERIVLELAEHSLADREVITEAMAEVWDKQGNTEKAIAVYNKLSLLEPCKALILQRKLRT